MTTPIGPRDEYGRPQDSVPGRDAQFGADPYAQEQFADGPRRGGFGMFPFPGYSTTTRNGTSITVGGCCLPLPLGCLATTLAVGGFAVSRLVTARR